MKRTQLAVRAAAAASALLMSLAAHAGSIGGGANLGGNVTSYSGGISGATSQSFNSNVTSAAETIGAGSSYQSAGNITQGSTYVGGTIGKNGANTDIGGNLTSVSTTFNSATGNSPYQSGNAIDNGSQAYGTGSQSGYVNSDFNKSQIGGSISVNGNVYGYSNFGY